MSIDYTQSIENLFESINVIVSRKLEDVSFDTTIVCTVVDDTDRKNGKYQVTNGTTKFDAYADSSDYRTGDTVRVQVLNGDYSGKKYIVGKAVTSTDTTPLTYVSPIDTIVNITGNLVDDKGSIAGLTANGTETSINLWGADLSEHEIWTSGIYSALTIRADFRTLLDNYDLKAGSYGLRVHLFIKPSKESTYYVDNYFDLDSSEMFGNPYAFTVYTKQGKKVALTTSGIVQHIVLSAYQKADFVNRSGNAIGAATKDNIFIKNIEIGFGSDLEKIDDNTVKIYTNSSTQYKYYQHAEETNLKTLGLLWYNKNDNNEYLGFSDGYYDPNYDELTYIAESKEDARLAAYMARDNMPSDVESLDLAANIDDAIPIFQAARQLVTGDLLSQLRSFETQLNGQSGNLLTAYTKAGDNNTLVVAAETVKKNEEALQTMYSSILAYWYAKSQNKSEEDLKNLKPTEGSVQDYAKKILSKYENLIQEIKDLLDNDEKNKESIRKTVSSGYLGVCDNYEARINRVLKKIQDTLKTLPKGILEGTDYPILKNWDSKTSFKSYQRKDFSSYDNKYCVYWYRANKDKEADNIMSAGWEHVEDLDNFGIPGKGEKVDGKFRNQTKLPAGENTTEYYMQYDLAKETFKAVVFYNHDKFISDELVFTNVDDIPDKSTLDKSDALVIKHKEKGNSRDNYNCYAMTNYLLNAADSSIEREVECYYDGLLAKNEVLVNARAYWYVPEDSTMITVNDTLLSKKGFVIDKSRPKQGYVCYYKKLTADVTEKDETKEYNFGESLSFWYRIKPYYEQSAVLNDIQCEVILANEDDEDYIAGQLTLTFGQQSTSGTKYTMVIAPSTIQRGTTASDNYLMSLHLQDAEGKLIPLSTEDLPTEASEKAYELKIIPVMSRVAAGGDSAVPSLSKEGSLAETDRWTLTAEKNNYGIYKASASIGINTIQKDENEEDRVVKTRYVDLIAWFNVPWSAGKNGSNDPEKPGYYLSGPTSIIYNNLGTLDNTAAYQTPYKLFNDNHEQVKVTWSLEYYKTNGEENDEDIDLRYMPSLNADNTLSPASMYLNGLEYYPVLVAKQGNNVLWRQPIIIMQNQYASNMLNDWDGSFQIDKENGTIMSSMIAAGRKTSKNTFEGVVMGCVAQNLEIDESNDSADGVGLYGFHDGAASFGVLADGTAFMGKAGNGRILINGNKGTIENAAYSQTKIRKNENGERVYKNPAGMQIDLENGKLTMRSASLGQDNTWYAAGVGQTEDMELDTVPSAYAATITMDATVDQDSYLDINVPYWNGIKWEPKSLIHIGDNIKDKKIEHSYYLQSQNYKEAKYNWSDGQVPTGDGAGMKANLVAGTIDAFKLLMQSKNIMLNSNGDEDKPYFVVKNDDGKNLIYCGKNSSKEDEFYLQSREYKEATKDEPGQGMRVDLEDEVITAYNFTLWSDDIYMSSGGGDGGIIAFTGKNGSYSLSMTNDPGATPLNINNVFKVGWDGKLIATNAELTGTITASGGTIGNWKITNGNLQSKNGSVTLDGNTGDITGSSIFGGKITIQSTNNTTSFVVDENGKLDAVGGTIENLEVATELTTSGNLFVSGKAYVGSATSWAFSEQSEQLYIAGQTGLFGKTYIGPVNSKPSKQTEQLYIGGSINIAKNLILSGASEYSIYMSSEFKEQGAKINAAGGKQLVLDAATGLWLKAQGAPYEVGGKGGCGIYLQAMAGNITLTANQGVFVDATYIALGSGVAYTDYKLTLPTPSDIYIPGVNKNLQEYIEENSGFTLIGTGTSKDKFAAKARALVTAQAAITLQAPESAGAAGQFLKTTDDAGTAEWATIYAPTTAGVSGHILTSKGDGESPGWTSIFDILAPGSNDNGKFLQAKNEGTNSSKKLVWTSLPEATTSTAGVVRVAGTSSSSLATTPGTTSDRYYGVGKDKDGKLYVNVPWTSGTTYTAGTGITISGGVISCTVSSSTNAKSVTLWPEGTYLVSSNYDSASSSGTAGTYMRATSIQRKVAATAHSSKFYKNTIQDIDNSDILYKLRPVSYFYNKDRQMGSAKHYGFIAEETEEFAPELVSIIYDKEGNRENVSLFYNSIIGLAVAEIQKLRKELDELKSNL